MLFERAETLQQSRVDDPLVTAVVGEHSKAASDRGRKSRMRQRLHKLATEKFADDFVLMGGYGHSRAQEFLLGGTTRDLTQCARTPLFLSH